MFSDGRLASPLWVWVGQSLVGRVWCAGSTTSGEACDYRNPRHTAREERQSQGWEE